ncbi:MAG: 1-phosphofructokinase [Bacillota bacterium]|nr:1-phosphofructokinase [Bacillota bacterium]
MISVVSLNPALDKIYFVDSFEVGCMTRTNKIIKSAGGKGINVARVLAKMKADVFVTGFLAGSTGEWLQRNVKELDIENDFIWVDGETRSNINIIDTVNETETELLESGPVISEAHIRSFLEIFNRTLETTKVLVCTGGLPEGIPANFYKTLIELSKPHGIKTILDASGEALKEGIKAEPDYIKPNLRELSQLVGKDHNSTQDVIESCNKIIGLGVGSVIASLGSEGAVFVDRNIKMFIKPSQINVVNAIGSGDSMTAGIAYGLEKDYSIAEMVKLGTACAMSNTQFREIGTINPEMVSRFVKEVKIDYLD